MFKGVIKNGVFIPELPDYQDYLNLMEGETVEVSIKKYRSSRSSEQNRYYWMIVGSISEYTGYTKDEVHSLLGSKFLKDHIDVEEGGAMKRYTVVKSTTSLNTEEMSTYIEEVKTWASQELNLFIPD